MSKKILVIADLQCNPDHDLSYCSAIGEYIVAVRPDIIVNIGDHFDFPSLSFYDKGKKAIEGRRLVRDIAAGLDGMARLLAPLRSLQAAQTACEQQLYNPRLVFCNGNHEDRFNRMANDNPALDGFVGMETIDLEGMGWEVHPFLKPVDIEGIFFVHYLANPMTGKPYGGNAALQLKAVGNSFVVGHKQCLEIAMQPTLDGKIRIGIVNGAAYPHDENYKGFQGNNHFRGIIVLNEVADGFGLPMPVSLKYLMKRFSKTI
jgi:hypothetical protein